MRLVNPLRVIVLAAVGTSLLLGGCGNRDDNASSPSTTVADEISQLPLVNRCLSAAGIEAEATESAGQISYPPMEPEQTAQVQACVVGVVPGGTTTTVAPDVLETARRAMAEAFIACAAEADITVTLDSNSGLEFGGGGFAWNTSKADRARPDYQETIDKCNLSSDAVFQRILADG